MRKKLIIGMCVFLFVIIAAFAVYASFFDYSIVLKGMPSKDVTIEYGQKFEAPKVTAIERGRILNRKGKEIKCSIVNNVDDTVLGEYEFNVSAKYKKKTVSESIKVTVSDTQKPQLSMYGDAEMTIEAGSEFADPGYAASDNYDGDITANVSVDGSVDNVKVGDYTISYSISDSSGNSDTQTRTVHVVDTQAPQIALSGKSTVYVKAGDAYTEPGYTASDTCDGDITDSVTVSGSVDTSKNGKYTLTYTVSDNSGNKVSLDRTVRVYAPIQQTPTVNPGDKVIYLTFDDGPGPYTSQLLSILDTYNVKATFFVTNTKPDYQNLIATEAAKGHTVAIHSATHNYGKIYASTDAYFDDLYAMNDIIKAQTGSGASIIRFPGGSSNAVSKKYCTGIMSELVADVSEQGFLYCDWNVSSGDAGGTTNTDTVVSNVISGVQKNNVSVVLQHDIKQFSVNAVEQIIQWGLSEGYTFLPLTTSSPMVHHGVAN